MKKLVFLFIAFGMMQVSAQSLSSLAKSATSGSSIEALAGDQVKRLTKKLNLNEQQQEQVSGLVVSQLKSDKFQKLLSSVGADKLMSSGKSDISDKVESTLMSDDNFKKEMSSILDDKQKEALKKQTPH